MKPEPKDAAEWVFMKTYLERLKQIARAEGDNRSILRIELAIRTVEIDSLMSVFRDNITAKHQAFTDEQLRSHILYLQLVKTGLEQFINGI